MASLPSFSFFDMSVFVLIFLLPMRFCSYFQTHEYNTGRCEALREDRKDSRRRTVRMQGWYFWANIDIYTFKSFRISIFSTFIEVLVLICFK